MERKHKKESVKLYSRQLTKEEVNTSNVVSNDKERIYIQVECQSHSEQA